MIHKLLAGGLLVAASIPVIGQTAPVAPVAPPAPMAPMADGVMTRAEVTAKVQAHFARLDSNRDGVVAGDELKPRGEASREKMVMRGDGGPGEQGPRGDIAAAFDRLDTNKDGVINRDEFAKGRAIRIEKRITMDGPGAARHPMRMRMHRMGGHMGKMMGGKMIKLADTNKDGRITLQEVTAKALEHFDSADANRDGRLTKDEMRAGHQRMRARMHQAS